MTDYLYTRQWNRSVEKDHYESGIDPSWSRLPSARNRTYTIGDVKIGTRLDQLSCHAQVPGQPADSPIHVLVRSVGLPIHVLAQSAELPSHALIRIVVLSYEPLLRLVELYARRQLASDNTRLAESSRTWCYCYVHAD